uniref:F-box protein 15 n=1 Tax=Sinocyclocheilus rhinocerous TaxID=307959 RepID=A0A673G5B1_9TELE
MLDVPLTTAIAAQITLTQIKEYFLNNCLHTMPPEIILRILSYLDPGSLFCISFVNKHFQELSNNNFMWYQFYIRERSKKKKASQEDQMIRDLGVVGVQERPKRYWRNAFFKEIAGLNVNKWRTKVQRIDPYSGLPRHTEEFIRSLCITWEITVTDGRGRRSTFEQSHAFFSSTAVFVFWGAVTWPPFNQLTSLELHGVLRVPLDCPAPYRCGRCLKYKAAGVSALFDDVDPEYGLHGYTAYVELHNTVRVIMSDRFSQLFCRRVILTFLFTALNTNIRKFSWSNCCLQDCCMINLTVWDEANQPFWCVSAPVVMTKASQDTVSYDFEGGSFSILYRDSEGRVEMRLKQMEYKEQYFVVNLVIYIAVAKVNKHFGERLLKTLCAISVCMTTVYYIRFKIKRGCCKNFVARLNSCQDYCSFFFSG